MWNVALKTLRLKLQISIVEMAFFIDIKMTDYLNWERGLARPSEGKEKENLLGKLRLEGAHLQELQELEERMKEKSPRAIRKIS